jgi:hypothetical protein
MAAIAKTIDSRGRNFEIPVYVRNDGFGFLRAHCVDSSVRVGRRTLPNRVGSTDSQRCRSRFRAEHRTASNRRRGYSIDG